ncbi:GtrA family protein [Nocardioides sp. KIGAM211]|uniref:GtrA family protein n=1 Tax=Nocardioides luti TaxID=2761101 RepID=A0A7X0RGL7_9ACTN|nr:GtrA family protein [Nocardioides luti]
MSTGTRFAAVGVVNTLLDVGLFLLLHDRLGIVAANLVSTSAGMAFSFVVNGRFTFGARRLTLRQAALFLATTGTTMWLVQPLVIQALLRAGDAIGTYPGAPVVLIAKLLAIGVSVALNFVAYRHVVWRPVPRDEQVRRGRPQPQP